jgi:hypothetical protein
MSYLIYVFVKSALHTTLHDMTHYSTRVADKAHFYTSKMM